MTYLGKTIDGEVPPFDAHVALLLASMTMIASDGEILDDELAIVRRLDGSVETASWDAAKKIRANTPLDRIVELVAHALNSKQRLVTLANLIDIAMADGVLREPEKDLLNRYVDAFGVGEEKVDKIFDVITLKNNKTAFER